MAKFLAETKLIYLFSAVTVEPCNYTQTAGVAGGGRRTLLGLRLRLRLRLSFSFSFSSVWLWVRGAGARLMNYDSFAHHAQLLAGAFK